MRKANSNQKNESQTKTAAELKDIKALLGLLLMKSGASQTEIAGAPYHSSDGDGSSNSVQLSR